jgi:diacylglycerol kinase (ATP)
VSEIKKKILFVINNLSGTVSQYNIPKCIDMFLDKEKFDAKSISIEHNMDESSYMSKLEEHWDIIISVGGDGTLLELGQKLMQRDIALGIIPIGSGNGLATHIGYKPRDIEGAFRAINSMKTAAIDVASMNGKDYFFSNFGIGIDSAVARDFKIKKKRSFLVYTMLTLRRLMSIKVNKIRYKTATEEVEVESYLFNVFNSNLYGYNVGLLPWASAFDGKLDVVYLKKVNIFKMAWAGICILLKKPNMSKSLVFFETEEITILNRERIDYQIDGDPKYTSENIHIKVLGGRLKMIVP